MTVAALTQTRAQIAGDGVTDRVDVSFQFVDEADLKVIHTDSGGTDTEWIFQESPGGWYFSGGDYASGTIHFTPSDLAAGEYLTVFLTSEYSQALSLDGGEIDPSVLERGMDRAALQIQSIAGEVGRALRISPSAEGEIPDLEIPDLPDGYTFVREGDALVPALLDSNEIATQVAVAQTARVAAETAQEAAASAQSAAETAQSDAETAASNASTSATSASGSATSASSSATAAAGSATSAASSATAAASSATSAASAKTAAETAETNAETAETNAASSASSASTSASAASGSASSASASASAASSSASSAASSATAAQTAQTAAEAAQAAAEAAASNDAAGISITAGGNLSATNVQAALEELDSEKAPVSAATTATSALNKANANETAIGDLSFALDFIATADLSNDATVEFTGFDPGAYDAYVFVLGNVVPSADGARLVVRLSNDGGSSFRSGASDYAWSTHRTQSTGSQDAADSSIRLTSQAVGSASAEHGVSGRLTVYFPHLSKKTMLDFYGTAPENSGTFMRCSSGGQVNEAEANNAIQLLFTSGNIESGTMTMYGMRNA